MSAPSAPPPSDPPSSASRSASSNDDRSIATALVTAGRVLRDRPGAILPAYLLALGVLQTALVPLLVGLTVALAALAAAGRLSPAAGALSDIASQLNVLGGEGGGEGSAPTGSGTGIDEPLPPETIEALAGLVTPTSVLAVGVGIVGSVLVWVLARSAASAVTHGTVWAAADGRAPLENGVASAGRWRTFLGLAVLRVLLVVAALVPATAAAIVAAILAPGTVADASAVAGAGSVGSAGSAGAASGLAFAGAALLAVVLTAGGVLLGLLFLFFVVFAGPAAVVDGRGALGAARASVGFVRSHPAAAIGFGVLTIGSYVVVGALAGLLNLVGVGRLAGLLVPLVLAPFLEALGTALYAGASVPPADRPALGVRPRSALGGGLRELVAYPRDHALATLAAAGSLVGAGAVGVLLTAPYGQIVAPPGDVAGVFGSLPLDTFVTLAVNNWLVSARLAFGGIGFSLPAIVGLGFNGLLVGALAGVSDPIAFVALVAPHGILELPAIALAGGAGIALGRTGWRALRGRADAATVAEELKRVGVLLVGLAIVLIVAAFIEAFLTPQVAAAVLG
jgi:hypothetical protein